MSAGRQRTLMGVWESGAGDGGLLLAVHHQLVGPVVPQALVSLQALAGESGGGQLHAGH